MFKWTTWTNEVRQKICKHMTCLCFCSWVTIWTWWRWASLGRSLFAPRPFSTPCHLSTSSRTRCEKRPTPWPSCAPALPPSIEWCAAGRCERSGTLWPATTALSCTINSSSWPPCTRRSPRCSCSCPPQSSWGRWSSSPPPRKCCSRNCREFTASGAQTRTRLQGNTLTRDRRMWPGGAGGLDIVVICVSLFLQTFGFSALWDGEVDR